MMQQTAVTNNQDDELTQLRRYQLIVAELSRLAATDPDLGDLLNQAVHHVGRAVDIDRIKVLRYRPLEGDLIVEAGIGWNEGVVGKATLPIGLSSPPGRAIQTGRANVIEDLPASKEFKASGLLLEHGIVSLIDAPIVAEGRCWGVLEVDSREPRRFSEDTVRFVETVAYLLGAAVQRKQAEAKTVEAEAETTRELVGREMLLREMQHRVKNNFQVIVSMALLLRNRAKGEEAQQVLQTLSERITAIALAHDQLDPSQGLRRVNLATYLEALCRQISDYAEDVTIETDLESAPAPIDAAVPLGLIVNETVTNALKHAFDGPGTVRVELRAGVGIRESILSVIDNGKGMGPARPGSSGLKLVDSLAAQMRGRVERETPGRGTILRVYFPPTG